MFSFIRNHHTFLFILITSCGLFGLSTELLVSGLTSGPHIPAIALSCLSGILLLMGLVSNGGFHNIIISALALFGLFGFGGLVGHLFTPVSEGAVPAPLAPLAFSGLIVLGLIALIARSSVPDPS